MPVSGPLDGIRVLELSGIGPTPYAGQILADLGAHVTRIERPGGLNLPVENRGKTCLSLDLKNKAARQTVLDMLPEMDIVFEGNRPGVMEKLGLGPKDCHNIHPALVYGRMTGWGQTGPWAHKAGHDINYIGLSGALLAMGEAEHPPAPPLNLVGDYGGGSQFLIIGLLAALLNARQTGKGCVIDAAIVDGTISMMGIVYSLAALGMWQESRSANLLDGSRPYYRCYQTKDGGYMAVGCLEPQFFAEMLRTLALDPETFGPQNDPKSWPEQHKTLEAMFGAQPRAYWEELFENTDACVTPVLSYKEAPNHKHNRARRTHITENGLLQPARAPRFEP
ncbi:MAG TPA: CoA transferase [Hellea balneolensis]|uniref:CoA transferase n=1 Tax=Hellea balneolensis TaxID=287478 RepID=A0A7V5U1C7_9PROT|nr:CoA transferase [Hellea balneolensis]